MLNCASLSFRPAAFQDEMGDDEGSDVGNVSVSLGEASGEEGV